MRLSASWMALALMVIGVSAWYPDISFDEKKCSSCDDINCNTVRPYAIEDQSMLIN